MTRDVGGEHRFEIGQQVRWQGAPGKVISLTVEPSVSVEFDDGTRLTVGQSVLQALPETAEEKRSRILAASTGTKPWEYDLAVDLGYEPESWEGMYKLRHDEPFTYMDGHVIAHEVDEQSIPRPVVHPMPGGWNIQSDQKLTGETTYHFVSPKDQEWLAQFKRGAIR